MIPLDSLNIKQREAVETTKGPVLVNAGPGSGKTRVITHRIAYLVAAGLADPGQILAVTFTNKAAEEMRKRVEQLLHADCQGMWIATFHAFCARLLRREAPVIGLSRDFIIYDTVDQISAVKQVMKELSINDKIFTTSISKNNDLVLNLIKKNEELKVMWGTTRSILKNAIVGVSVGHEKILELTGVGFRAMLKGTTLNLQLGFSHDTSYEIPKNLKITVEKQTIIKISGIDKELVGRVASEIKMLKPVETYKGKGIKERGQYVIRKEGKKK